MIFDYCRYCNYRNLIDQFNMGVFRYEIFQSFILNNKNKSTQSLKFPIILFPITKITTISKKAICYISYINLSLNQNISYISQESKLQIMSSLHDEQTTSQHIDIGKRVMNHLKSYSFLIYYQLSHLSQNPTKKIMNLQKISFKLKDDKNPYTDKYGEYNKNIHVAFYDIENQKQVSNSLHDLKVTAQEFKTKLVFYSSESEMVRFYHKAKLSNVNIDSIPICIYTLGVHGDFSRFLGWGRPRIDNLCSLSVEQIQGDVRKWVESPAEKIDIWSVQIKVSEQNGSIERLNETNRSFEKYKSNTHRQLFMSSLSIGYHPHLLLNYQQKKATNQPSFLNKLIYSVQGMKKFCCVGNQDMRESTGVVKIDFVDQKGQHQILKYLRDPEGDQDSQYLSSKKQSNRRKVLSIVLSNIDIFFGQKLKNNQNSKMNDQKLQLLTFQSKDTATKLSSIPGNINMQFSPDHTAYVQINDSCYKLEKPLALKVEPYGKARVIINKEMLNC